STSEPVEVSKPAIDAAVERGRRFLLSTFSSGGSAPSGVVSEDQVLFTCFACGLDAGTEDAQKLRRSVGDTPLSSTYQAAFRALALSRLDPAANREGLEACARYLLDSQLSNGQWSYGPSAEGAQPPALGDNSNTAYALLGLAACRKAGVDVPRTSVEKA